ncbi:Zinc finger protein 1 TAK1-interacting protein 27 [Triplophysa tibetana]|uniref:Zinc finger protein 1 TAK1-interacting protein 27 n=1 Tax=Triplophysa tibetana TaxID=1572043 RepID=A0A5A9N160_9TELE|nr:Zinc finger protein 1 TAK1-interacting protein 27 [Triplophysa tibetana]
MRQLVSHGTLPSFADLLLVRCEIWHRSTLAWRKPNYKVGWMDFGLSYSSSGDLVLRTISALIDGRLNKACSLGADVGSLTDTDPRMLEKQELQQPTYVALSYINRFMTDAARREHDSVKKKVQPKLSLSLTGNLSRNSVATPPRHNSGNLTPPVTPPITPSSSFRSSTPTGSEYDEEEADYEESDSDESWTTESAISSESILSSMCMNGGDEKPFACPVPGCKKKYKNVNGIKYHAKNGHRTQIRVRKPFKCRCGKSYKSSQGLRHHTINFHPPVSADIIRKMQQ